MRQLQALRAWDDVANKMLYARGIEQFDDMLGFRFDHFETENPIYMWPTGLTDRVGKEIYEGDIIHIPEWKMNGEVNFASGMFKVRDRRREQFNPSLASFMVEVRCEVIGDIYTTPHLIES